jgi:PAS domain S-box-containing protein
VSVAQKERGSSGETAIEFRIVRRDGAVRFIRGCTFPVFDSAGALIRVARTWEDVTERALVADRLRLQAAALECAANAIVVTDERGRVEWTNPAFSSLTGYRPDEIAGATTQLLKSRVQDDAFYRRLWETITAGRVWHGTLVNRRADGSLYDEEMTISPVADADGKLRHFVAVKQDVTEAKRAAETLRETQELLSQASDAIVLETVDGRVRTWTQGAERLFGWTTAEALGEPLSDLLGLYPPEKLAEIRDGVAKDGAWVGDLRVRSHAGAVLDVASRWSRVTDLSGKPRGVLLVAHDARRHHRAPPEARRGASREAGGPRPGRERGGARSQQRAHGHLRGAAGAARAPRRR